jgi:hypothetical protein
MRYLITIVLILTTCSSWTIAQSLDDLSLVDLGRRLNGHWKLELTQAKNDEKLENPGSETLTVFEFEGLRGMCSEMTDNKDGTFSIPSCQPTCELKEDGKRRLLEYTGLVGSWVLEIIELTDRKLVLTGLGTTWTYKRQKINQH